MQTVLAREQENDNPNLVKTAGFSVHAGVAAKGHQRRKLERLCRYIARPAVATDRLALTPQGMLDTPWKRRTGSQTCNGTRLHNGRPAVTGSQNRYQ